MPIIKKLDLVINMPYKLSAKIILKGNKKNIIPQNIYKYYISKHELVIYDIN